MGFSYIAGFFDADGSISLLSIHKNEYKSVQVSFCNNERHRIAVALQYYNEVTNRNGKSTERAISRKEAAPKIAPGRVPQEPAVGAATITPIALFTSIIAVV